ncbi:type II secretion system protein J [Roseiconus sp. JC912]
MRTRCRQSHCVPNRTGHTLIEVIIAMTILMSMFAGILTLVVAIQRSSSDSEQQFNLRQQIRRFADDFRNDFHHSEYHTIQDNKLRLNFDGQQPDLVYEISDSAIVRINDSTMTRERYSFGNDVQCSVASSENDSASWAITLPSQTPRTFEIFAIRSPIE